MRSVQGLAYYIETFGCQMNEQDSLRMAAQLDKAGCTPAPSASEADILIVNTCSIRKKAEEKAYSLLGRFRSLKKKSPSVLLAVGGCVAQQEGAALLDRMPHVDLVFGPHHVNQIGRFTETCMEKKRRILAVSLAGNKVQDLECAGVPAPKGLKAFVTVMEGCTNFCSYCIVPYVRGAERSRPVQSVRREIENLVEQGVREVTLLGQNVNAYRAPDASGFGFPDLLKELNGIDRLKRLRFTTSHPKDLSKDLIQCFGELQTLCEHIHLPLQAGSDRVLAGMNRSYTVEDYLDKIQALRKRVPEIAITSDMIVGFPGEGERDFLSTIEVVKRIRFDGFFSFKFSPRPGTRAADMEDTVPATEKVDRLKALQELQKGISLDINRSMVGRRLEVFTEGESRNGGQWTGRTRTNKVVNFPGPGDLHGHFLEVTIQRGLQNSLLGRMDDPPKSGRPT